MKNYFFSGPGYLFNPISFLSSTGLGFLLPIELEWLDDYL